MRFQTGPGLDVASPGFDLHITADGRYMVARRGWLLTYSPTGEAPQPRVIPLPEGAWVAGFLDDAVVLRDDAFGVLNTATGELRKLVDVGDGLGDFVVVANELVALGAENQIVHVPIAGGDWTRGASLPGTETLSPPVVRNDAMIWTAMRGAVSYVLVARPPFDEIEIAVEHDAENEFISNAAWAGESIVYAILLDERGPNGKLLRKTGDKTELLVDDIDVGGAILCDSDSRAAYCWIPRKRWRIDATSHHELSFEPDVDLGELTARGYVVVRQEGNLVELRSEQPLPDGATLPLVTAATIAPPPPIESPAGEPTSLGELAVEIASPQVRGSLPADIIKRIVRAHKNELVHCGKSLAATPPTVELGLGFVISDTGKVASASISKPSGVPEVDRCVAKAAKRWQFPKPQQGVVTVDISFTFTRS